MAKIFDTSNIQVFPLADPWVFQKQYEIYVASEEWQIRNTQMYNDALLYHMTFYEQNTMLWWASIIPFHEGYIIFCLWCYESGKWYGTKIIQKISCMYGKKPLYAYSKKKLFFEKVWFIPIENQFSQTWAQLYKKSV